MYEGSENIIFINDRPEKDALSLSELKITINSDLILDIIDEETIKQVQ